MAWTWAWVAISMLLPVGAPAWADQPDDFIVQQVCVDGADRAVTDDPAHCGKRRKLRVGEVIPYRRVDAGNWQALYSYPVRGLDGEHRAMAEKVFGGNDTSGFYGDLGIRSGYDLLNVGPDYISGIRTSDPGGGDQIFWRNVNCERTDGWIMFPPGLERGQRGEARSTLKITPGPSTACPRMKLLFIAPDFTTWERPLEPIHYTSGKVLDTITSEHFAYGDPENPAHDNDSMEKFYFTREYGFSRWEAWETPAGCQKRAAKAGKPVADLCTPSPLTMCNGDNQATFFGKAYLRLDCRDSTYYVATADKPFNPLVNDAAPGDVFNRNLVTNGTIADGRKGWRAEGVGQRLDVARDPRTGNAALRIDCVDCSGAGVGQEIVVPPSRGATGLHWGASVESQGGAPVLAKLVLTLHPDGQPPQRIEHAVTVTGAWTSLDFDIPWRGGAEADTPATIELLVDGHADLMVDDLYVALLDKP
ncbi:hypothetical protein [Lichenihabitans psoromatis]|uniref:hypothetical protein n=1 Tax=Lichenihabitans psoromatis TaxID=2528642 RepID=UPI001038534E|nr:hypothetical protein [Lichenihabitans psoromatis]